MKVLSLFDGMSCALLTMQGADIPVERYVAYEIDKYAIQTAQHNFPNIEQKGDVFKADFTEFKGFDYLMGGSPCTYWSIAQNNNRETEASGQGWELFMQYVRALREAEPKYFVYENNKSMSKAIRESITETFGFEPICINSALVSAQNRPRLYWVGKRNADGTYSKVEIEQPEDRKIVLKDLLECGECWRGKSYCIDANYYKGGNFTGFKKQSGSRLMVAESVAINTTDDDKSQTIKAQYHKNSVANFVGYTSTYGATRVAETVRVGALPHSNGEVSKSQSAQIYSVIGKSTTLCANGGGAGAKTGLYAIPVEFTGDKPLKSVSCTDGKEYTVYEVKDGLITIKDKQYPIKLADGFYIIRKLTVRECMRLQTVPEWYEFPVSDTQAYKMLGNGWTVEVIIWLLQHTKEKKGNNYEY